MNDNSEFIENEDFTTLPQEVNQYWLEEIYTVDCAFVVCEECPR
jgi:hypothetical protein